MTPLERIIRKMIAADGPMALDRYMELCLGHPQYGYYMTRDPLGAAGDFTTAPEISQVFGELIGVWVAQVWHDMGSPAVFSLVELGPGRGTLMKDLLRATAKVPGLHAAIAVHLVETSPVLRSLQKTSLGHATWHESVASLPAQPSIIVANEFFDALPVKQYQKKGGKISEIRIGIENGQLAFGLAATTKDVPMLADGVFELALQRSEIAISLGHLLSSQGGAALVIDYGHRKSAMGDTVQAMKDHDYCGVLDSPGDADITSHVDFQQLAKAFRAANCGVAPVLTQGEFLLGLGLAIRAETLTRSLAATERDKFSSGIKRLADDTEMGQLFKVMAVTGPGQPVPYPFGVA